jgi:aspartyl-tRNA synthetase
MPTGGLEALKSKDPGEIKALQYDLIGNGYELLSGSIRNHHPETFLEAFKICGYTEAETRAKFGHMLTAFEYGAPPHGGFALGLDRFSMILFDENNIREIYAFPMSGGQEIMTESPKPVSADVLNELGLKLKN